MGTPSQVAEAPGGFSGAKIQPTADGGADAVWTELSSGKYLTKYSHTTDGLVWTTPSLVSDPSLNSTGANLVTFPSGKTLVSFLMPGQQGFEVSVRQTLDNGQTWSAISTPSGQNGLSVQTAKPLASPDGNAVIVWESRDPQAVLFREAFTSRISASGVASSAISVTGTPTSDMESVDAAYDGAGRLVVSWVQGATLPSLTAYSRTSTNHGQSWLQMVDAISAPGYVIDAEITQGPNGELIIVWEQADNGSNVAFYATLQSGSTSWSSPQIFSPAGTNSDSLHLSDNPGSPATACWMSRDANTSTAEVYAGQYLSSQGWTVTALTDGQHVRYNPVVTSSSNGQAGCMWLDTDSQQQLFGATLPRSGSVWGSASPISLVNSSNASGGLAILINHKTISLFYSGLGSTNILYSSLLAAPSPMPDSELANTSSNFSAITLLWLVIPTLSGILLIVLRKRFNVKSCRIE